MHQVWEYLAASHLESVSSPLLSPEKLLYGVRVLQWLQKNFSQPFQDMEESSAHTEGQIWNLFFRLQLRFSIKYQEQKED